MTGILDTPPPSEPSPEAHSVTLELPHHLHKGALRIAAERHCSEDDAILQLLEEAVTRRGLDGKQPAGTARAPSPARQVPTARAAWRVEAPSTVERPAGAHEWAENLLPTLPLRFQRYVAELLFDDERILFFLHRLPFRRRVRWWRLTEELEGLLVITDRMLLLIEDSVPPGHMFVAWGYAAWMAAVERIASAGVVDAGRACGLRVACRATSGIEERVCYFPAAQAADLLEAAALLNRFGGGDRLPARTYPAPSPEWEPPERRTAGSRIMGRLPEEASERDMPVADVSTEQVHLTFDGEQFIARRDGIAEAVSVREVSSIAIWRGVQGCTLDWHVPADGRVRYESVAFQYPQGVPFLRIASRLRHAMGRPVASSPGPTVR
jgi:hypothetical protein